jgi:hypothetical protein
VRGARKAVGEASGRRCAKRLVPFLPELVASRERHGELVLDGEVRRLLRGLRAAPVDRLLVSARSRLGRRPSPQSGALASRKAQIPLRPFGEWAEATPGEVQAALVAHGGESAAGQVRVTWTVVDGATRWTAGEGGDCGPRIGSKPPSSGRAGRRDVLAHRVEGVRAQDPAAFGAGHRPALARLGQRRLRLGPRP